MVYTDRIIVTNRLITYNDPGATAEFIYSRLRNKVFRKCCRSEYGKKLPWPVFRSGACTHPETDIHNLRDNSEGKCKIN